MLRDDFFTVKETAETEKGRTYRIALNASHPIFRAHFAGSPVMPGACIAQVIKELAEDFLPASFFISAIKNMKFLQVIDPRKNPEVSVRMTVCVAPEGDSVSVASVINDGDCVFSKSILVMTPRVSAARDAGGVNRPPALQEQMDALRLCVVIPTYNNRKTLAGVIRDVLQYTSNVIVVNDGSTDDTAEILNGFAGRVELVSYRPNRGKGHALKSGFDRAEELGYRGAVAIDSDGQHAVADMRTFVRYAETHPGAFLIGQRTTEGNMPAKNSFANKFSNFWFTVHTSCRLDDTQNGFRLYPLAAMRGLRPVSSRYEAEFEMLVRSAWKGLPLLPVPVRVYYPPEGERVTHFRPAKDFLRISALNTLFLILAAVYGYPSILFRRLFNKREKS
ncbi:MAG: glycosyltransferase [Tannerella sp.]|jgi:3-hydroxymyristoyl/3-hydroxydecanoyl-(acyl carrier protein) dehydratase|nr:glycosyltransferase [Tannerella sp.]